MVQIMIVDDERFTRDCLANRIKWSEYGVEVAATAGNGIEALEKLSSIPVDIIITDIKMPKMDGVQLLETVKKTYPWVQFVIISGFEEFEYAKQAINLGACAYILKPIEPDELISGVRLAQTMLQKEKSYNNAKEISFAAYLKTLLYGNYSGEEYDQLYESFVAYEKSYIAVAVAQLDNISAILDGQLAYAGIIQQIDALLQRSPHITQVDDNLRNMLFVACTDTPDNTAHCIRKMAGELKTLFASLGGGAFAVAVSGAHLSVTSIDRALVEAMKTINFKYLFGTGEIYDSTIKYEMDYADYLSFARYEEQLIALAVGCGGQRLKKLLDELFDKFAEKKTCIYDMRLLARNMVCRLMGDNAVTGLLMCDMMCDLSQSIGQLYVSDNPAQIKQALCKLLTSVSDKIGESRCASTEQVINKAKSYIKQNYASPALSLLSVAQYMGFNAAYFSTVFSNYCGISLINYINSVRIQQAKQMLVLSDKRVLEIAEETGFTNATYFSTLFKKLAGVSPSEYRIQN